MVCIRLLLKQPIVFLFEKIIISHAKIIHKMKINWYNCQQIMRHSKSKRKIVVASTTAERRPSKQTSNNENWAVSLTQAFHYNSHTQQTFGDQPTERKMDSICRRRRSVWTYSSSGVSIAGSRVNCGSKLDVRSASAGSNVGIKGGGISFCASFWNCGFYL